MFYAHLLTRITEIFTEQSLYTYNYDEFLQNSKNKVYVWTRWVDLYCFQRTFDQNLHMYNT